MLEYIFFPIVEDYWGLGIAGDALAPSCLMKTMYLLSCTNWLVSRLQVPRNKKASEPVDLVFLSPFCFLAFGASGALQREIEGNLSHKVKRKKKNEWHAHPPLAVGSRESGVAGSCISWPARTFFTCLMLRSSVPRSALGPSGGQPQPYVYRDLPLALREGQGPRVFTWPARAPPSHPDERI